MLLTPLLKPSHHSFNPSLRHCPHQSVPLQRRVCFTNPQPAPHSIVAYRAVIVLPLSAFQHTTTTNQIAMSGKITFSFKSPISQHTPAAASPSQPLPEPAASIKTEPFPTLDKPSSTPADPSSVLDAADAVEAFLAEESVADKLTAIDRILSSFTLNPFAILALPSAPSLPLDRINRQYRTLSLLVHPDKIAPQYRERAQAAFARLADARGVLLDAEKREVLEELISQARQHLITERESDPKRRLRPDGSFVALDGYDATKDADFDAAVEAVMKEMLIDKEWAKRQRLKHNSASDGREEAEKEQRKRDREEKAKEDDEYESKRESRVSSWRAFQQGAGGGKKRARVGLMSGPKASAMDGQHSYVRRAVG